MGNVFQNNNIIFKYNRNKDNSIVQPKIFLKTRTLKRIGLIDPVFELNVVTNFNEANTCSFTIHRENNGVIMPLFDRIKNLSIIEIQGFGLFQLDVTTVDEYDTYKKITGTALQESELSQLDCTLEINTDVDTARSEYDEEYPTLFYRDLSNLSDNEKQKCRESSLLHRILTYAPLYSIGHVDNSLMGINRQFSCNNSCVWDFLQDVAEEVGCVFICDPFARKIDAYDLKDHCTKCGGRHIIDGKCSTCGDNGVTESGYGLNTAIYVDTTTIAQSIEDSVDTEQIKNCFKLVAGDDDITNRIGQRLIGNSNYIWCFSEDQIEEFSDALKEKWLKYPDHVNQYQDDFDNCWNEYNKLVNDKLDLQSGKMPVIETDLNPSNTKDKTYYEDRCKEIYNDIVAKIPYYVIGTKNAVLSSVSNNILKFANFICPAGYKAAYQTDASGQKKISNTTKEIDHMDVIDSFTCYLYVYLANCKDENQKDKYYYESDVPWKISVKAGYDKMATDNDGNKITTTDDNGNKLEVFSHNYYLYLKQMIDYKLANSEVTLEPKYNTDYADGKVDEKDPYYYKNYFKEYSINRLTSFKDAYDLCVATLFELDSDLAANGVQQSYNYIVNENGGISKHTMYEKLTEKYTKFSEYISGLIKEYTSDVEKIEGEITKINNRITEINNICNIKNYLNDDELYNELISFKRVQTYENSNFTSNVIDESVLMENVEEFILLAKEEIAKSCRFQHNVPISMSNLLTLTDYENVFDIFALGNYINTRINGELVKLRIISIPFNFDSIESCEVVFSDALVGNQRLKDIHKAQQKSSSIASSFDYVQKQTTKNDVKLDSFSKMFSDGLDATKTMIMNADDISTKIDNHGIMTRQLDLDTGEYLPEQIIITNGSIGYTSDGWQTIKSAFGKFFWNGEYRYGLIGEAIVGKLFAGQHLTIGDEAGNVRITRDGITLKGGNITWDEPMEQSGVKGLINDLETINVSLESLNGLLDDIAADEKLTAAEKKQLNITWIEIQKEYEKTQKICEEDDTYKNTVGKSPDYEKYKEAYKALSVYLLGDNGLLLSLDKTSDINPDVFKNNFSTYFEAKESLNNIITNAISKENAESVSKESINSFQHKIAKWMTGEATTSIDSNSVFAPHIGGGYLYISNTSGCSVEINPLGTSFNGHNGDYVFNISKNGNIIMGVDNKGNGYFKGKITGSEIEGGTISGATINGNTISGGTIDGTTITGGKITSKENGRNIILENGMISFNHVKILTGLLNYNLHDSMSTYSNSLNFACEGYAAEFGFRWDIEVIKNSEDVVISTTPIVNLISAKERPLNIGEKKYPIRNIIINGTISNCNDSYLNVGGEGLSVKNITASGNITANGNIDASGNITANGNITAYNNTHTSKITANYADISNTISTNTISTGCITIGNLLRIDTDQKETCTIFGDKSNPNRQLKFIYNANYSEEVGLVIMPINDDTCVLGERGNSFKNMSSHAFTNVSDRKLKKDIEYYDSADAIQLINHLKPARYKFKDNTYGKTHYGLIAQDVEDSILELGWDRCDFAGLVKSPINYENQDNRDFDGSDENYSYSLRYDDFISPIISYCQGLYKQLQRQEEEIQKLKNRR